MARTETSTSAANMLRMANGSIFDDAGSPDAASINLGFKPRYVRVDNVTDRTVWEWYEGMTTAHSAQTVAAGTRTLITSGGITVSDDTIGFAVTQNKQLRWHAYG